MSDEMAPRYRWEQVKELFRKLERLERRLDKCEASGLRSEVRLDKAASEFHSLKKEVREGLSLAETV